MKKTVSFLVSVSVLSAFVSVMVANKMSQKPADISHISHPKPYLLIDVMHQFQRYADKIYFSAQAQNPQLTGWYLWKLEQSAMAVSTHKTEPWNLPSTEEVTLMRDMFIPAVQDMYEPVKSGQWPEVNVLYETLVATCNSCHEILEHGYVNIQTPKHPTYSNQNYKTED